MDEMNNKENLNENVENEQPVEEQPVQPIQPPVEPPVYQPQPDANNGQGMSIASLVLGIASVVLTCLWYLAVPCGIVGLILGIMGGKKQKNGMATAGIVLSIIGLVLTLLWILGLGALIGIGTAVGGLDAMY